jgi:hypothetical protein
VSICSQARGVSAKLRSSSSALVVMYHHSMDAPGACVRHRLPLLHLPATPRHPGRPPNRIMFLAMRRGPNLARYILCDLPSHQRDCDHECCLEPGVAKGCSGSSVTSPAAPDGYIVISPTGLCSAAQTCCLLRFASCCSRLCCLLSVHACFVAFVADCVPLILSPTGWSTSMSGWSLDYVCKSLRNLQAGSCHVSHPPDNLVRLSSGPSATHCWKQLPVFDHGQDPPANSQYPPPASIKLQN